MKKTVLSEPVEDIGYTINSIDLPSTTTFSKFLEEDEHEESKKGWRDIYEDQLKSGKLSYIKAKVEEELLYPENNFSKKDQESLIQDRKSDYLKNLIDKFIYSKDKYTLVKILFECGLLHDDHNAIISDNRGNIEIKRDNILSRIRSAKSDIEKFYKILCSSYPILANTDDFKSNIEEIFIDLYLSQADNKLSINIDSSDMLIDIIREFSKRGVKIDQDLIKNKIDFSFYRKEGVSINIFYYGYDNILLLSNLYYYNRDYNNHSWIYKRINNIGDEVTTPSIEEAMTTINGEDYPTKIVESMLECSVEDFINQIKLETYLNGTEQERVGDGDNDSFKNAEIL